MRGDEAPGKPALGLVFSGVGAGRPTDAVRRGARKDQRVKVNSRLTDEVMVTFIHVS